MLLFLSAFPEGRTSFSIKKHHSWLRLFIRNLGNIHGFDTQPIQQDPIRFDSFYRVTWNILLWASLDYQPITHEQIMK